MAIILGSAEQKPNRSPWNPAVAWRALRAISVVFVLVSIVDLGLAIVPADLANPANRFVTLTGAVGGLPVLATGTIGFLMAGIGMGSSGMVRAGVLLNGLVVVFAAALLVGFIPSYHPALAVVPAAVTDTVVHTLLRGLTFGLGFLTASGSAAFAGLRYLRGR